MDGLFGTEESLFKDQTQYSWHDPLWMQMNKLTEDNCLEYFYSSIFYDKNPQLFYKVIKINTTSPQDVEFRIVKWIRDSGISPKMISMYFIIDGIIFQSASLRVIIEEKLDRASFCIKNAIELIHKNAKYSLNEKNPWKEDKVQVDFDYDILFEDNSQKKADIMISNAINSIDD